MDVLYQLSIIVAYFFIYGFLGWCTEVVFQACVRGKFINRGFLNGAICPIYGFGVVGVTLALKPVQDNFFLLLICSIVLTSTLEFLTGLILEKIFHLKWWDYSNNPFNLMGYICLGFSLIWGFACVFVVDVVHPVVEMSVEVLPQYVLYTFDGVLSVILVVDATITIVELCKLPKKIRLLTEIQAKLHDSSDWIGSHLAESTFEAKDLIERSKETAKQSHVTKRLEKAFPNLQNSNYATIREMVKDNTDKLANQLEKMKDSITGKFGETKDAITEKFGETKDAITEKFGETKDAITEKFGETKDAITGKFGGTKDSDGETVK